MKAEMTQNKTKKHIKSIMSMMIILIGALGVGLCLMLSEILYPEIEEFIDCPLWYRTTMYASLIVVACGIVCCLFTKNKANTSQKELNIEFTLCLVGIIFCSFALSRNESYWKDIIICIGGSLLSIGLFCGVGTVIGLKKKSNGNDQQNFANVISNLKKSTPFDEMWDNYSRLAKDDEQGEKEVLLLCVLYNRFNSGSGLYGVFEEISDSMPYETYEKCINESNFYSLEIKSILLNAEYEKAYYLVDKNTKTEEEWSYLEEFEKKDIGKVQAFVSKINDIFVDVAIKTYLEKHSLQGLPEKYEKLYFSADKRKRIVFFYDESLNAYTAFEEIFEFENELYLSVTDAKDEFQSRGFWTPSTKKFGIYPCIDDIVKDLQDVLASYEEFKIEEENCNNNINK